MIIEGLHEKGIFTEDYPFRMVVNDFRDFSYPSHWHSAVEFVYILENDFCVHVNNNEYVLQEKDILIIAGGDMHTMETYNNNGKRVFIQFDLSLLSGFVDMNIIQPYLSCSRIISPANNFELHRDLENQIIQMINADNKKDFAYPLYLNARVFDILVILGRNLANKVNTQSVISSNKKIDSLEKLNMAFQYIENNYQNNITLKDVARAAGFSEYHLSRVFKEVTEKSFRSYINEYRIKKAEKLLMNSNNSIAQIAFTSGFNSISTFNRAFKEIKGCTPSIYKDIRV